MNDKHQADKDPHAGKGSPAGEQASEQREALARAERAAAADRPADYQEERANEKIVSTRRDTQHEAGDISGIDNDRASSDGDSDKH